MGRSTCVDRELMIERLEEMYKAMEKLSSKWVTNLDLSDGYPFQDSFDEECEKFKNYIQVQKSLLKKEEENLVKPELRKYKQPIEDYLEEMLGVEQYQDIARELLEAMSDYVLPPSETIKEELNED